MAMAENWSTSFDETLDLSPDEALIRRAKKRFKLCEEWEAIARIRFVYDYKFANGDAHNKYQWDSELVYNRELQDRPCLTINRVAQHNLMIINDAKQNKSGVKVAPVGESATFEASEIMQELIYHIEYISNADNVYDYAVTYAVQAGIGYWRVDIDYIDDESFDKEIYIRRIKDPLTVYLDPDINEIDGSDARYGFIFEDCPKDLFKEQYPDDADIASSAALGNTTTDMWITQNHVRIAEYFEKEEKKDKLVYFIDPENGPVQGLLSKLTDYQRDLFKEIKKRERDIDFQLRTYQERKLVTNNINWYKIAGNRIIDRRPWIGNSVPIVRVPGTETVIDGILDRKGHTRAMLDPQKIYNWNSSANVEFGALQTKAPWVSAIEAIEGLEEYYKPLALDTPLPTPNGWTTMGEVKIGDWLFDENGNPVQVMGLSAIHYNRKCYKITFDDGSDIIADEDHLWTIEKRKRKVCNAKDWVTITLPTKFLQVEKDWIWSAKPFVLENKNLPIDPYILGVWLGDGSSASNRIHSGKEDIDELLINLSNRNYEIGSARENKSCFDITIHGLRKDLVDNNLLNNKHIPEIYLRCSHEQRLELLQGLMDTDGHYHFATKRCIFVNTNKNIIDGVFELLRTLGIKSVIRQFDSKTYYRGEIRISEDHYRLQFSTELNVFKLTRKASIQNRTNFNIRRIKRFQIISIEEVNSVPVRCVAINSESHLFLAGVGMIPTHNTANTKNHSVLPYKAFDDDGNQLPAPERPQPPQPSPAYTEALQIAQNEMMMVSGQYQSQFGENENAKSGVAINARQRQGDRSTYHFIDNQAIAIRRTGKILLDLIPKVYDTKRIKQIEAKDGDILQVTIDPDADIAYQNVTDMQNPMWDKDMQVKQIIFNPKIGYYDLQADAGPSFATRRQEAFNALSQIAAQNPEFMHVAGDILWKVADFPEAQVLAQRWRKIIPPNVTGDAPDPQTEQAMHAAADKIQQQLMVIAEQSKKLEDKSKEYDLKMGDLELRMQEHKMQQEERAREQARLDYDARTKRLTALGNFGPNDSPPPGYKKAEKVVNELLEGMQEDEEDLEHLDDSVEGIKGSRKVDNDHYVQRNGQWYKINEKKFHPSDIGAIQADDGHHYIPDPSREGKFMRVMHE